MDKNKLSIRSLVLGAMLSIFVCAYSAFAGLKLGGVYWPIVTTSLISMAVLMVLGKTNKNEINIMQTAGSSGGLLAAGIIFTLPAAFMLGYNLSYLEILLISLVGGILGIIFSYPLRKALIEKEKLPCSDGAAAAALIEAGDSKGKKAKTLIYAFGLGAIVSIARDWIHLIPSFVNLGTLKISGDKIYSAGTSISLIPIAGGFLIGPKFATAWFFGALLTYFIFIPYALTTGLFTDKAQVITQVSVPLGVGIVLGSAAIYFLIKGLPLFGRIFDDWGKAAISKMSGIVLIVCAGIITILTGMNIAISILAIAGAFAMSYIGARSTAEMNINPMELFAMLIMILAKLFLGVSALPLIILAAIVTIAAGMAGDMMQDLKSGYLLGIKLEHQILAQIIGMVSASLIIGMVLLSIQSTQKIGTAEFAAPQAIAIKELANSSGISKYIFYGGMIGGAITILLSLLRPKMAIAAIAFGIGAYVPIELSMPLFLGGLIRYFAEKSKTSEKWRLAAGGIIAGEGISGVVYYLALFVSLFFH